jgi:hypothetical protein
MKRLIAALLLPLALSACGGITISPTPPGPAYEVPSKDLLNSALDIAWHNSDSSTQVGACSLFQSDGDAAWNAFSRDGTDGVTRDMFESFFGEHC